MDRTAMKPPDVRHALEDPATVKVASGETPIPDLVKAPDIGFADSDGGLVNYDTPGAPASTRSDAEISDDAMYPCVGNKALARLAYVRYMTVEGVTLAEIAEFVGVPYVTVVYWAEAGKWTEARMRALKVRERDERQAITFMRLKKRRGELAEQVSAGEKLRETATGKLDEGDLRPNDIKALGDALKAASDVSNRALGVNADGVSSGSDPEDDASAESKKQPLVIIVPGGGLPNCRPAAPDPRTVTQEDD